MRKITKNNVPFIQSPILSDISHGFFTRQGGVSTGLFSSLNCTFREDDPRENVLKNRSLAMEALSLDDYPLMTLKQVHGKEVKIVDQLWDPSQLFEADALVTMNSSVVLGIQTADCVPILLADVKNHVIGAVHAGWRGALKGVVEETINVMISLGAKKANLLAAIGPAIAQESYEVGPEVYQMFVEKNATNAQFFLQQEFPESLYLNLPGFVESILVDRCHQVERLPYDTYDNPDLFFSCRRSYHEKFPSFGGHISLISLGGAPYGS